ncbi:hypothetical protein FNV43_RR00239 [Rhamnella rubrinervis]|uniref:Retrotransposon gag domain-containing protein n=1 Tax=Rhamnella rubrinervis TaxID=2594499 RepID=A0A8K0HNB2_9ROSA|nr:hypothetical protein FNV43_RR00239 [Rhamnella rubrinervis]
MPVVEPVAAHTATSRIESSSASYTGRRSHRGSVPSTFGERYHDVGLDDDSTRRELRDADMRLQSQKEWRARLCTGFGGPPVAAAVLVEDSEEDLEEDSLGTDEYIPRGYTLDPVDPEDFDPWDEPARDATSHLVEAIERLVAQNKREEKEAEFISLKQGNLSLVEYERKFDELSRYAPLLVDTEECKA